MQTNNNSHTTIPTIATELNHAVQGLAYTTPVTSAASPVAHHEENQLINLRFVQLRDDINRYDTKLSIFLTNL